MMTSARDILVAYPDADIRSAVVGPNAADEYRGRTWENRTDKLCVIISHDHDTEVFVYCDDDDALRGDLHDIPNGKHVEIYTWTLRPR
ncbi:MAG TPA: hypothetical protein VFS75_02750 [Candidatus Paceibacterota bacterium]|nr:hypothetical protein [Candidatus Paceibacterota bacterium]